MNEHESELNLSDQKITNLNYLDDLNCTKLTAYNCSSLNLLTRNRSITELEIKHCKIEHIQNLQCMSNVQKLIIEDTQIQEIQLETLTKIAWMSLRRNKIKNIHSIQSLSNITQLTLAQNQIIDPEPLSYLHQLTWLDISNNSITKIEFIRNLQKNYRLNYATQSNRRYQPNYFNSYSPIFRFKLQFYCKYEHACQQQQINFFVTQQQQNQ
ncbi:leucine-rich_repeat domain-containing protein [Hexamita inflata]|uniref:Leucine-rich repeat domain-containing protein n=1 Tax=Hexamita inflata TaxID=28002 RepID=A0AA86U8I1_9EUKA|nr:leucine-rich repeat domain-containing protein [Hexamita inflata]